MAANAADAEVMDAALSLAARTLGDAWPNPAVGCILVKDNVIVGRGWTQSGGRPHAETEALRRAGPAARGATAYVSLEPCSHQGQTGPCADALVNAGVARVVAAATDPDPRVSGQGIAKLRAAGILVDQGVRAGEAERLNRGFFLHVTKHRPLFALKAASTLDGRIALASGESRWITGAAARHATHVMRSRFDAILVGSDTALTDNPLLTCRVDGYAGRPKVRIVLDRRLRVAPSMELVRTARKIPTWFMTADHPQGQKDRDALAAAGVEVFTFKDAGDDAGFAAAVARTLADRGLTRVLIEGGGTVSAAFLRAGLIDEVAWFRAASLIGGDGRAALGPLGLTGLSAMPRFQHRETLTFGGDTVDILTSA